MRLKAFVVLSGIFYSAFIDAHAQPWTPIRDSNRAIDWSKSGVGNIPLRPTICARLAPGSSLQEINEALRACPAEQSVYLEAGTYAIPGTIVVPGDVTLRGAGADRTILKATGTGGGYVVAMGAGSVDFAPIRIVRGANARSSILELGNVAGVEVGKFLVITETNDPRFVSVAGSEGSCNWCDGWVESKGERSRGQIVMVTAVTGDLVTITPGLYSDYTHDPIAVPFRMSASYAGVENLQVYATNTGYDASFGMSKCAYCWIKGVEANYADGDPAEVLWGFHDEIRDSYFSNAFLHKPGNHDSGVHVAFKTSASLIENNIIERTRISIDLGWGAAGNVFGYNYTMGEFSSDAPDLVVGGFRFHGAHAQFNLIEGNVVPTIVEDPIWGTASHTTVFRNWVVGTNRVCRPLRRHGEVQCAGSSGHYAFQSARAIQISYLGSRNNFAGNVLGSLQMQQLRGRNRPLKQVAYAEYPTPRSYDETAYGWSFGYGPIEDRGTGTGCGGGVPPCHLAGTAATNFFHGNYNNVDGTTLWSTGITHRLPASLYLPDKPTWWGILPYPSTGPDVNRGSGPGGHSFGNPAQFCYIRVMGGSDGGEGGPRAFNADTCYATGARTGPH